jgi:uncharacterized damage-inducible protein DinB
MSGSAMKDAFGHHVWATTRLIDVCIGLPPEQLATAVPGTYGSILDTQRHLVGSDAWYLRCITDDETAAIDEDHMDLRELRSAMERNGARWSKLLADELDPDAIITQVDHDDGYQKDATVGIRFAQALHHGTDHRSQICTALTSLGVEPPPIDVWDFGVEHGRVVETFSSS